jgi:hypothetical protein
VSDLARNCVSRSPNIFCAWFFTKKNILTSNFFFLSEERLRGPLRLCGRRSRIATLRRISRPSSFAKERIFFYCFAGTRCWTSGTRRTLRGVRLLKFVHAIRLVRLRCFLFHLYHYFHCWNLNKRLVGRLCIISRTPGCSHQFFSFSRRFSWFAL